MSHPTGSDGRKKEVPSRFHAKFNGFLDVREGILTGLALGNATRDRRAFLGYPTVLAGFKGNEEFHRDFIASQTGECEGVFEGTCVSLTLLGARSWVSKLLSLQRAFRRAYYR